MSCNKHDIKDDLFIKFTFKGHTRSNVIHSHISIKFLENSLIHTRII